MNSAKVTTTHPNVCHRPDGMPTHALLSKAIWTDKEGKEHLVSGTPGEFWYLGTPVFFKFSAGIPAGVPIELFWS